MMPMLHLQGHNCDTTSFQHVSFLWTPQITCLTSAAIRAAVTGFSACRCTGHLARRRRRSLEQSAVRVTGVRRSQARSRVLRSTWPGRPEDRRPLGFAPTESGIWPRLSAPDLLILAGRHSAKVLCSGQVESGNAHLVGQMQDRIANLRCSPTGATPNRCGRASGCSPWASSARGGPVASPEQGPSDADVP
jgi:hypothetical protein